MSTTQPVALRCLTPALHAIGDYTPSSQERKTNPFSPSTNRTQITYTPRIEPVSSHPAPISQNRKTNPNSAPTHRPPATYAHKIEPAPRYHTSEQRLAG